MTHRHPENLPVVQYYLVHGDNISYTWRAGCTSVASLALNNEGIVIDVAPDTCHLLVKDPMERFKSAWIIQPYEALWDEGTRYIGRLPINDYIDGVLDDVEGVRSPHSWPQLKQHSAVKDLIVHRLEGSTHMAGCPLHHLNKTEEEKPELTHRVDELREFYAEDITAWESAEPWKQ